MAGTPVSIEEYFAGFEEARSLYEAVAVVLRRIGAFTERATKTQVAFLRRTAFAWVWIPEKHLGRPLAPLVLTVDLPRRDPSPRWKSIVEPRPGRFTHHLELYSADQLDDEVVGWLTEAWNLAE